MLDNSPISKYLAINLSILDFKDGERFGGGIYTYTINLSILDFKVGQTLQRLPFTETINLSILDFKVIILLYFSLTM